MEQLSLPLGQIVRENLSVIMSFAYSRTPLENLIDSRFEGEWKNLIKTVLDLSEERAVKACIELAIFLRVLDDEEKISESLKENSGRTFGKLTMSDGTDKPHNPLVGGSSPPGPEVTFVTGQTFSPNGGAVML
jgi:hypothetical protein